MYQLFWNWSFGKYSFDLNETNIEYLLFFERFKLKRPLWGSTLNNSYFVIQEKYNIGKITLGLLVLANSLHCKSVFLDTALT